MPADTRGKPFVTGPDIGVVLTREETTMALAAIEGRIADMKGTAMDVGIRASVRAICAAEADRYQELASRLSDSLR